MSVILFPTFSGFAFHFMIAGNILRNGALVVDGVRDNRFVMSSYSLRCGCTSYVFLGVPSYKVGRKKILTSLDWETIGNRVTIVTDRDLLGLGLYHTLVPKSTHCKVIAISRNHRIPAHRFYFIPDETPDQLFSLEEPLDKDYISIGITDYPAEIEPA